MKSNINLVLINLLFAFFLFGCAADQQSPMGDGKVKDNNKPYAPSRNHIPRN
jgi:hypothetical protein